MKKVKKLGLAVLVVGALLLSVAPGGTTLLADPELGQSD